MGNDNVPLNDKNIVPFCKLIEKEAARMFTDLNTYKKICEYIQVHRSDKNALTAEKIFKACYIPVNSRSAYKRALSELEIKRFLDKNDVLLDVSRKLWGIMDVVQKVQQETAKLTRGMEIVMGTANLLRRAEAEKRRLSRNDITPRQEVEAMFQAKASMDELITLLEDIGFHKELPIAGKIIGVYFEFFKMTTGIMEKVRNYALRIIDEAEKALGTNGAWWKIFKVNAERDKILLGE
ncbi:MAG: hypothetical protein BWY31_01434 [Lentisphaerae bacterium ADurb.Bin242]|nr:MAG: hypothetical protein BWY31_01434 [Lentisphaerae bacterium ADurb.Bin242]